MSDIIQQKRNEALQYIKVSNRKINNCRLGANESMEHGFVKAKICKSLIDQGKDFITEAIFKTGGRADIFVLDDFRVIEIMKSEDDFSIETKKKLYPKNIRFELIKI